jgi:hypothetical protein
MHRKEKETWRNDQEGIRISGWRAANDQRMRDSGVALESLVQISTPAKSIQESFWIAARLTNELRQLAAAHYGKEHADPCFRAHHWTHLCVGVP